MHPKKANIMKSPEQISKIQAMVLYILQYFKEGMDYIKLFKMMYFAQREYFAVNGLCIVEDTFNRWWTIFVKCN